ncbi:cell division protein FtsQ/DivIB [Actinomyces oris]|uniref:FtsQ-type POTRA domain-containing protein n=1 Tax=Actinomyces oris TaxID=544580 RepID=A0AAW9KXJ6_9ACTO|nr:FtsQ-type POTRA domain-containing protein [Actinomyces oris]MEA1305479.1 FtsQ-type POTRA domain-containing protein [Actinomyces oris]
MRKPSAPRPERSNRAQDAPARIPPRRSGPRRPRPTRSAQGPSAPSPPTDQGTEQAGPPAPANLSRSASASRAPKAPGGAAGVPSRPRRPSTSRGASSPSTVSRRGGEDTKRTSPRQESSSPDAASSTELTVFGRRQVALSRGDDRVVSTGLADRLKERQDALRRLRLRRVVRVSVVVLAIVLTVWALTFSPLLGLQTQRISVAGSDGSVSDKQVREVLAAYAGDSLLRLDTGRLSTQVSDKLVRVRRAQVTRAWPHGLRVHLTMRVPVATVQDSEGYQVLDNEAVVLERVPEPPSGLVNIVPDPAVQASGPQRISAKQVAAVTQVVGSLTPETLAQVSSGSATEAGQVTLTLSSGASVVWGNNQDNQLKARVLATLMTTTASIYDVSSPHRPTTRSTDGATTTTAAPSPTS